MTVCIPTFGRPGDLERTLSQIALQTHRPQVVLVSEASIDQATRLETDLIAMRWGARSLPPAPCANRSGNRNWLNSNAETKIVVFVDDDVDMPLGFLEAALRAFDDDHALHCYVAGANGLASSGWLTARGHFRPRSSTEPICIGFQLVAVLREVLEDFPLDEVLSYGYEDADLSLRLLANGAFNIQQSPMSLIDRGGRGSAGLSVAERAQEVEKTRVYVCCKRYANDPIRLFRFLVHEAAANTLRLRRPLPHELVAGQYWLSLAGRLHGVSTLNARGS